MFTPLNRSIRFLCIVSLFTCILFWPVFLKNQIPFSANLLASSFNPWMQEKFPGWEVGIPNRPTGKDDVWIFYPQRTFSESVLKNWEIPFWNPYSFNGNYHLGLSETAVFYPLNVLFLVLSQVNAWVVLMVVEPVIAGFGMYLFLRRMVTYEKSAILGAFAFGFSGIVISRAVEGLSVGHTLIWLPYVFWGIEAFFQTKRIRYLWIIMFALSFSLFSGWFQFTFYIFVFSFLYALYRIIFFPHNRSKENSLVFLPFIIVPFTTLFHTIPAFFALLDSPRSALEGRVFSSRHLVPFMHVFTLIIPDFWGNPATYNYFGKSDYKESIVFIGVVPLLLSIVSIYREKKSNVVFFTISILVSFVLAIDNPLSKAIISLPLPVLSSFLPDRIFLITAFSFAVICAHGFDYIHREKRKEIIENVKKSFFLLWIAIGIWGFFIAYKILKDPSVLHRIDSAGINRVTDVVQFRNSILPVFFLVFITILFFIFRNKYSKNVFFILLLGVLFLQNFLFAQKYIPFSSRQFMYPNHPVFTYLQEHQGLNRFMSAGHGHIVPSIPLQFFLYSPEGIGSMYIRRYGEFVRYMKLGDYGIPDKIAFDLEVYPKDVFAPKNNRLYRFFELTNVKYVVVDKKSMTEAKATVDEDNFSLVWENKAWQIYEFKKSLPRFFTTSNYEIISKREKILDFLFGNSFDPDKIVLEEYPGFRPKDYKGNLEVDMYSPNKISIKTQTEKPTLVYFSDNYTKQFKAFVDGKETKILRANYTFRAIPVGSGNHKIIVVYNTKPVLFGFIVSLTVVTVLAVLSVFKMRIKKV